MKKEPSGVYLFLSVLEGMLSGSYFYLARRERQPLNLLTAILWLACSVCHGLLGLRDLEGDILVTEDSDDE